MEVLLESWDLTENMKTFQDGVSETFLYESVREKLRDPEREVRQHALRVLMDLIPVTHYSNLDVQMQSLLPELIKILGLSSPSLRKGALDCLKKYLRFSKSSNYLMKELLGSSEHIKTMAPFLIGPSTDEKTVQLVIDQLWKDLENSNMNQEDVAKALARLRYNFGDERFKHFLGLEKYYYLQEICEQYSLPIDYSDGDISDNEKLLSGEELIEDRVILETEITLRTGPAITMKIHEESRPNSVMEDSLEENSKFGVIKVLHDDNDSDFEEVARRTPRKVRFGGESVKLRTPESDSSTQDDSKSTLSITVTDAVSITTKKSLIPVRITSLPSTPLRSSKRVVKRRLYQSVPNLTRNFAKTRIPFRRDSNLAEKFKIHDNKITEKEIAPISGKVTSLAPQALNVTGRHSPIPSPSMPHKEIELFHNLTRSPVRQKRATITNTTKFQNSANPFINDKLYPTSTATEDFICTNGTSDVYDSFEVYQSVQENKINTLPPSEDIRINPDAENNINTDNIGEKSVHSSAAKKTVNTDFQLYNSHPTSRSNEITALECIPYKKTNEYDSFKVCSSDSTYPNTETSQDEHLVNGKNMNGEFDFNKQWQIAELCSNENVWDKSEALDNLVKMLKQPNTCDNLEPGPAALLFEALFACQHLDKLHFLADDALALMIRGVRPEVLDQCLGRLSQGLCKIGAPSGVNFSLLIMKKCPPNRLLSEVMDRCFAHKTREGALQILMSSARLLPRNELEVLNMIEFAAATLRDRRRRVRHAALETLATLAQLSSTLEVLDVVERVTKAAPDHQYMLRVVRTRLSRRQLPTVELDGNIRYSSPRDQTELEWLSGRNNSETQSISSSASSSNNSVNYWRRNSRHDEDNPIVETVLSSNRDESTNGNQQIWAVDPAVFPKNGQVRESNIKVNPPILRPVYILQPEAVSDDGKGHRRYDRGRSFSPPKPNHKQPPMYVTASTTQHLVTAPKPFSYREGVRKSFSSEQLFVREKEHHDPYSFALSSRSSTTSTGSSTKSGNWHKEMRSGIPVPISSETKFRLRTNSSVNNTSAPGPVIARRELSVCRRFDGRQHTIRTSRWYVEWLAYCPKCTTGTGDSGLTNT